MTIEELENKHKDIESKYLACTEDLHTKLSIEFAIEVLENLDAQNMSVFNKIQELKQYLDGN